MAQSKIDAAEAEVGLQKMSMEMAAGNEIVPEAYDASVAGTTATLMRPRAAPWRPPPCYSKPAAPRPTGGFSDRSRD